MKTPGWARRLREHWARLTERERWALLAGGGTIVFLLLLVTGLLVHASAGRAGRRVSVKSRQLREVIALQSTYRQHEQERRRWLKQLDQKQARLVSLVEEAARQAGVEIGQLRPEDGEPSAEGIVESTVDLRASNLSIDRVRDFLERLKRGHGLVVVRRLKLSRPYGKDTLQLEMSVTTFVRRRS